MERVDKFVSLHLKHAQIMNINTNNNTHQKIIFFSSFLINMILTIIIFATLSEKQIYTYFNSDTLYLPSIYKDIFIDKTGFAGWHLNGAPNFLPDMLLFFLVRSFFGHFIPACFTFSLVQLTIVLLLFSALYKTIFKSINYIHLSFATVLMSLFLLVTVINNDFVYTFYLLSISYHMGAFIMLLISTIFLFRYLNSGENKELYLLFIIAVVAIINDRLFLVMFSFPVFAFSLILLRKTHLKKTILRLLVYNILSIVIGLFIFRMLKLSGYISIIGLSWKVFNFENIIPALKIFSEQHSFYLSSFDIRGIINILSLVSLTIHIYFLVKKTIAVFRKNALIDVEFLYLLFFTASVFLILITPIINGSYVSWALLRYNIYSLYLAIFSYCFLLYKLTRLKKISINYLSYSVVIFLITVIVIIVVNFKNKKIKNGLDQFMTYYPENVKCIDELSKKKNIKYGAAEYWKAKYITMFSKQNVRVYTILENSSAWFHVTNENWYYSAGKGKFGNPEFNFIITNGLNKKMLYNQLKQPKDTINCNSWEIFTYSEFQFNKKTRKPTIIK